MWSLSHDLLGETPGSTQLHTVASLHVEDDHILVSGIELNLVAHQPIAAMNIMMI